MWHFDKPTGVHVSNIKCIFIYLSNKADLLVLYLFIIVIIINIYFIQRATSLSTLLLKITVRSYSPRIKCYLLTSPTLVAQNFFIPYKQTTQGCLKSWKWERGEGSLNSYLKWPFQNTPNRCISSFLIKGLPSLWKILNT